MGATSGDTSSAGMAAAIEANLNAVYPLFGRAPSTELHDDAPDLRWYITPHMPFPLFNHVYLTRLPQGLSTPGSRRSGSTSRRTRFP